MLKESAHLQVFDTNGVKQAAADVIRAHSKTFYFATNFLPRIQREAIRALYAFCRTTDDLVDRENATQSDLDLWREQVKLPLSRQTDPVLLGWASVRDEFQINRQFEQELIDGVEMDLVNHSYATWEDLKLYCYRVAATVGLLSIPIIGLAKGVHFDQAAPFAIQLGIALQLTNILRDIGEDRKRGRVYLPIEHLKKFNLSIDDIHHELVDQRFIQLMQFEISLARDLYRQALPGIAMLSPSARVAVSAAAIIYSAILDEIEKINFQVFQKRAHTNAWQKIFMLPRILSTAKISPW